MVDIEKVRIMTKLAVFEQAEEENALKITQYYQGDYVRCQLLKTLVCVTIGYICLCGLGMLYQLEYLIENATTLNYPQLIKQVAGGYFILLLFYGIGVTGGYIHRYHKAKKRTKGYDRNLHTLRQLYRREQGNHKN